MSQIVFRNKTIKYSGRPEFWESLPNEGWEPETFTVLERFLGPGKVFLDIGSWNGVLSIYASLLGAECFSYEPDPIAFNELLENVILNESHVTIAQVAIAMSNGKLALSSDEFGNSMSSLVRAGKEHSVMVPTATLASSMKDLDIKPDLIKIDTEGAESVIIPYSLETLRAANCPLLLSLHPQWLSNEDVKRIWDSLEKVYDMGKTERFLHEQYLFQL